MSEQMNQPQQIPAKPMQPPVQPQQPVYQQPPVQPQQPVYQPPVYQQPPVQPQPVFDPTTQVMSVGSYIGMFILSAIPIVNIICWIVWLVSPNTNRNKKNYIIATIVLWVIGLVLSIVLSVILAAFGVSIAELSV